MHFEKLRWSPQVAFFLLRGQPLGMFYQKTIARPSRLRGVGLHTGERTTLWFLPAPEDSGIRFIRVDQGRRTLIPAHPSQVASTFLCTSLGQEDRTLSTVEHLLAALAGLGIDNLCIEVQGPELPILDGSAGPFVETLVRAGLRVQKRPRKFLRILEPLSLVEGHQEITAGPADHLEITYTMDLDVPFLGRQSFTYDSRRSSFTQEIARARTFTFLKDVHGLREQGLIKGGSLENAIVIGSDQVLNEEGLRFPDEPVRHKVLDLIGDLALLGYPLLGCLRVRQGGHRLHTRFIQHLLANRKAWTLVCPAPGQDRTPAARMQSVSL